MCTWSCNGQMMIVATTSICSKDLWLVFNLSYNIRSPLNQKRTANNAFIPLTNFDAYMHEHSLEDIVIYKLFV